jgi:hypothetical protein
MNIKSQRRGKRVSLEDYSPAGCSAIVHCHELAESDRFSIMKTVLPHTPTRTYDSTGMKRSAYCAVLGEGVSRRFLREARRPW